MESMQQRSGLLIPAKTVDISTYHSTFYSPPPTEASSEIYCLGANGEGPGKAVPENERTSE